MEKEFKAVSRNKRSMRARLEQLPAAIKSMPWKRKLMVGLLLAAVLAMAVVLPARRGIEVRALVVERGEFVRKVTEEGVVRPEKEHAVYSLYAARVEKLAVREGDRVSAGELLAVLEVTELNYACEELQRRLDALSAELAGARESLRAVENNYRRASLLYEQGWVAKMELEEAERALKTAQAGVESLAAQHGALSAQLKRLEYQMENYEIYAPASGVVANLNVEEGGVAGPQLPLMRLFNEDEAGLLVETRVLTRDAGDIAAGMPVALTFAGRDEDVVFTGRVIQIYPRAEESLSPLGLSEERVTVKILPEIPENLRLSPGYKVEVTFTTKELYGVLVVPKTAIFTFQGEDALFVVEKNRARVRKVTTGCETRQEVVITGGLAPGDRVILDYRTDGLEDGCRVRVTVP